MLDMKESTSRDFQGKRKKIHLLVLYIVTQSIDMCLYTIFSSYDSILIQTDYK